MPRAGDQSKRASPSNQNAQPHVYKSQNTAVACGRSPIQICCGPINVCLFSLVARIGWRPIKSFVSGRIRRRSRMCVPKATKNSAVAYGRSPKHTNWIIRSTFLMCCTVAFMAVDVQYLIRTFGTMYNMMMCEWKLKLANQSSSSNDIA
jgi:hypothetical protein